MRIVVPVAVLLGLSAVLSILGRSKRGTMLGIPYNLEWPTPARLGRSVWDPHESRLLTPHAFGWGYSVNGHAVARRLRLV